MPTRLVLKESAPSSSRLEAPQLSADEEEVIRQRAGGDTSFATPPRASRAGGTRRPSSSGRKVVGLRSSILRDLSHHEDDDNDAPDEAAEKRRLQLRLSNEDIRASPRLLGYLFGGIASTVMLVSVVQFYLGEERTYNQAQENQFNEAGLAVSNRTSWGDTEDEFFQTINGPVFVWKLWACIAVASASVLMFFIILLMHFDTICFPRMWFQVFRDGSLAERNILMGMIAFWAVSLHVNTSSFSVGEAQANVFFTSWIVFICTVLNLGVWRQSANLPRLAVKVMIHHRETMYNWCWTLMFNLITAGAGTDMYFYREEITFRLQGEVIDLDSASWMRILAMLWSEVALCLVAIFFNHFWSNACKLNFPGGCRFVLNWRFLEGVLIFVDMGFKFWIILTYTGVDGVITGLNNAYFGIWGSFFNIVFTFGTWLRENKDIDYII